MKYSGIGGQAVMEGVMMKNQDRYAVAVRKPDQDAVTCLRKQLEKDEVIAVVSDS